MLTRNEKRKAAEEAAEQSKKNPEDASPKPETSPVTEKPTKRNRKKASKEVESKDSDDTPPKPNDAGKNEKAGATKDTVTANAADIPSESPTPKAKPASQNEKEVSSDTPKATDITPAELKKKRSAKGIEKKKGVVAKTGKTGVAKKEILGKTAKVRF